MAYTIKRKYNKIIVNSNTIISISIFNYNDTSNPIVTEGGIFNEDYIFEMENNSVYIVNIDSGTTSEYILFHFVDIITNLVKEVKSFLCNKCNGYISDCNPCDSKDEKLLFLLKYNNLTSKLLYVQKELLKWYPNSDTNNFNNFIYRSLNTLSCKVKKEYETLINEECVKGFSDKVELYKSLITVNFLGLYFLENSNSLNFITEQENYINDLFEIEKIKNCLCNTCFRFEELEDIFNEGVINPPTTQPANLLLSRNINLYIESNTQDFSYTFNVNDYIAFYNDIGQVNVEKIKITSLPNLVSFINSNQQSVTLNQEINASSFSNYFIKAISSETVYNYDSFNFKVFDGTNWSSDYVTTINLIKTGEVNPLIIIEGFIQYFNSNNLSFITKQEILEEGIINNPNSALITHFKVIEKSSDLTIEKKTNEQLVYSSLPLEQEVNLSNYTSLENILKIIKNPNINVENSYIKIAIKDDFSNSYSNETFVNNFMEIKLLEIDFLNVVYNGGFFIDSKTQEIIVPVGRVSSNKEVSVTSVNEISGFSEEIDNKITVVNPNNSLYNVYTNSNTLPQIDNNHKDLLLIYPLISDKDFNIQLEAGTASLTLPVSITINKDTTTATFKFYNLTLSTVDSAAFDYLTNETNWEADFINSASFITSKTEINLESITSGTSIAITTRGFIAFAITKALNFVNIFDSLNNNVTSSFTIYTNFQQDITFIVSNNIYVAQTIYFKFQF